MKKNQNDRATYINIPAFRNLSNLFQRSINKTCCPSEDKFITEDTMAKVLQFIRKLCLQGLFTGRRGSGKENRDRLRIGIG
jgi:hypothetical protein